MSCDSGTICSCDGWCLSRVAVCARVVFGVCLQVGAECVRICVMVVVVGGNAWLVL